MFNRMHIKVLNVIQLQKFNMKIIMKVSPDRYFFKEEIIS